MRQSPNPMLGQRLASCAISRICWRNALGAVSAMRWLRSLPISRTLFHTSGILTTMRTLYRTIREREGSGFYL